MNVQLMMSGMYADENYFPDGFRLLDFRNLEGTSLFCSDDARDVLEKEIRKYGADGLHLIDNGDFHYLSAIFMENIGEEFDLILLDNHSDDRKSALSPDLLHCGGWVDWSGRNLPLLGKVFFNSVPQDCRPQRAAYLSIDLDILDKRYFLTDWDQGLWTPDRLLATAEDLGKVRRIIGADICGGTACSQDGCSKALQANAELRTTLIEKLKEHII